MIHLLGKKSFTGKEDRVYHVIFYGESSDQVEGYECFSEFVSPELYDRVSVNGRYNIVYRKSYNGKAVIADLIPVNGGGNG